MQGKADLWCFLVVFAVSLTVYTLTLAPTVTLEYSGSMITAADYLGVANSPGYPVWTLLAWLFQNVFDFVRYHGQPNPAWGVNFMSAFFGALSGGTVAWLTCRTLRDSAHHEVISLSGGVAAGLLFAFSRAMWSQSVIAEMVTLNVFSVLLFLALTYLAITTRDARHLYGLSFLLGIGFLNSPTFVLMLPVHLLVFLRLGTWRHVPGALCCLGLGLLPLVYLPLASAQNPPINWGYPRTREGFLHLITRGQYERIVLADPFHNPGKVLQQMAAYGRFLLDQYPPWMLLLSLPSVSMLRIESGRLWILLLLLTLLLYSVGITLGLNANPDIQTLFIARVQWIPSCAVVAMLTGLGMGHALSSIVVPPLCGGNCRRRRHPAFGGILRRQSAGATTRLPSRTGHSALRRV